MSCAVISEEPQTAQCERTTDSIIEILTASLPSLGSDTIILRNVGIIAIPHCSTTCIPNTPRAQTGVYPYITPSILYYKFRPTAVP